MFGPDVMARAEAHFHRAEHLRNSGRHAESLAELDAGLLAVPIFPMAHLMRAELLHRLDRLDEAEASAAEAERLARDQGQPLDTARLRRARILMDRRAFADAAAVLRQLAGTMPGDAAVHYLWGAATYHMGEFADSVRHTSRALSLPGGRTADACNNLGLANYRLGQHQRALAAYEAALAIDPGNAEAHTQRGVMLLLLGRYNEGWPEWEWRSKRVASFRNEYLAPEWKGEDITGKTLLIYVEQGFGDMLNFARFFPVLAGMGARLIVVALEPLVPVMASVPGVAEVLVARHNMPLPPHDFALPVMSLAGWLHVRPDAMPGDTPYIEAPAGSIERWRQWLGDRPGLKVGIAWAGSQRHFFDASRSMELEMLKPLALPGLRLISLQQGPRSNEDGMALEQPGVFSDFGDTAGMIANLDLVITVDTSVAHLAGAMGRETWLMLPNPPEWRWGTGSEKTPWYPCMRLFRQKQQGNWAGVVSAIRKALSERLRP